MWCLHNQTSHRRRNAQIKEGNPIKVLATIMLLTIASQPLSELPIDTTFKAYMDYRKITDVTSDQWKIQQKAVTDESGLRKVGDAFCAAVGTHYATTCGDIFTVTLEDGSEFKVIVSDIKQDEHTNETNQYSELLDECGEPIINNNDVPMVNVIEFIVDTDKLPTEIKIQGSVSELGFEGNIINICEGDITKNANFKSNDSIKPHIRYKALYPNYNYDE